MSEKEKRPLFVFIGEDAYEPKGFIRAEVKGYALYLHRFSSSSHFLISGFEDTFPEDLTFFFHGNNNRLLWNSPLNLALPLENCSPCHLNGNSIENHPNDHFHMFALEFLGHEPGTYQRSGNRTDG